jgi:HflK protein
MGPNEYHFKNPFNAPRNQDAGRPAPNPQKRRRIGIPLVILALLLVLLSNSFYELQEDEFAVITTFGKPAVVSTSGLKFKIPFIQQKNIVSKATKGFPIGYDARSGQSIPTESVMITVDYNFVNVDFYVEYRVTDPVKYLYNSEDPVGILKMLCQSYIRDTIGLYKVDDVITTGKSEIQAAIKDKILNRLEQEDLGITLVNITIQDAEPPTNEVQIAFKAVETAKQDADTSINNANKYANEVLPAAQADADEVLQQAEAYKTARINEANGQASRFSQLFEEYSKYPEITRQRLFYEKISEIFPGMKVIIMGKDGSQMSTVLPLDDFTGGKELTDNG